MPNRRKELFMTSNNVNNLVLAAAFAGLLGGTTARLNAQPVSGHSEATASSSAFVGVAVAADQKDLPKHACKGQNDCKGQGGGATRSTRARMPARVRALAPRTVRSPRRANLNPCRRSNSRRISYTRLSLHPGSESTCLPSVSMDTPTTASASV